MKIEGFKYVMSLELKTRYFHIRLMYNDINLCTIILPQGKYKYKWLNMGYRNYPYIFQVKMNEMF